MTLDDYLNEWAKDAKISPDALDEDARNVPLLHAKWWRYYTTERLRFKKFDIEYKKLERLRWEYWLGKLDDDVRLANKWPTQPLKILSNNVDKYLASDDILIAAGKARIMSEETLRFLEDVIKSINNRNFSINTALNYLRFKMGT